MLIVAENEKSLASLCDFPNITGDGFCDDESNIHKCNFDGGDCCGNGVKYGSCLQCKCLGTYEIFPEQNDPRTTCLLPIA